MANEVTINFNMLNTLLKYNIVGNFNVLVRANAARGARPWCLQVCDIQPQNWSDNYNIFLIFPHTKKKKNEGFTRKKTKNLCWNGSSWDPLPILHQITKDFENNSLMRRTWCSQELVRIIFMRLNLSFPNGLSLWDN